jgi:hypothetical protein
MQAFMFENRTYNRAYDLAVTGDPIWAEWTYEQGEWERFLELDARRIRRSSTRWLLFTVLLCVGGGVFALFSLWNAGTWIALVAGCLVAVMGFVFLTAFGNVWFLRSRETWYEGLKAQTREIAVTPIAIVSGGKLMHLMGNSVSLRRVWVAYADRPQNMVPVLKFQLEKLGSRRGLYEVWVPVPRGKESEGRELAERFQREIVRPARSPSR